MDTKSVGELTHRVIVNDMISNGYNDIDQFIILDMLILYFDRVHFQQLDDSKVRFYKKAFQKEQDKLSLSFEKYSKEKLNNILDTLNDKPVQAQRELLFCYYLQFRRGINSEAFSKKNFAELFKTRIALLTDNQIGEVRRTDAEILLEKIDFPLYDNTDPAPKANIFTSEKSLSNHKPQQIQTDKAIQHYDDRSKLSLKEVAVILRYHESHVRRLIARKVNPLPHYRDTPRGRMYFFYPELLDWMKSNRQQSSMEEAGNVFRRKPKGFNKRRTRLR